MAGTDFARRVSVSQLSGVPETLVWALYNRAAEARRPDAFLNDPLAVQIADNIDYDYVRSFGRPDPGFAIRAVRFDQVLKNWLREHPGGQVIALGEGLETQFHRVDDGRVHWLSVDLPEAITVRSQFVPDTDRHRNLACSALDFRWMEKVIPGREVFFTAAGLLMYLQPDDVRRLITSIAERFVAAEMIFDVIPHWFVRLTTRGVKETPHYTIPPMPWGLNRNELQTIKQWHPNIAEIRELTYAGGRGFFYRVLLPAYLCLPWVRNKWFSLVHMRCRPEGPSATLITIPQTIRP